MSACRLAREHLPDVAEIERETFASPWSEGALELLLSEAATGAVCLSDGRAVAYGGMLWAPDEGQITNIAVLKEFRGRGFGDAVLSYLIGEARERRCVTVSLEVRESNVAAVSLYEKHGFFVAGKRKRFYTAPTEDALIMILELNYEQEQKSE